MNPQVPVSDRVQDVKRASTNFINKQLLTQGHFHGQKGLGAFSYCRKQVPQVTGYILNQEAHYRTKTFRQAYTEFLEISGIEYNDKYLFEFYD